MSDEARILRPGAPPHKAGMRWGTNARGDLRKTYILFRQGGEDIILECELYATELRGIPPVLDMMCPSCGNNLAINSTGGASKEIEVHEVHPPRRIVAPDGVIVFDNLVTVKQVVECSHAAPNGKGRCGLRLKITEGRASRVS